MKTKLKATVALFPGLLLLHIWLIAASEFMFANVQTYLGYAVISSLTIAYCIVLAADELLHNRVK